MIIFDRDTEKIHEQNIPYPCDGITPSQLCVLKAFCQFLDISTRCKIELIIKIIELKQTIRLLNDVNLGKYKAEPEKPTIENIFKTIKEQLPPEQSESIKQMEEMMETMQLYQEMMSMKEDE